MNRLRKCGYLAVIFFITAQAYGQEESSQKDGHVSQLKAMLDLNDSGTEIYQNRLKFLSAAGAPGLSALKLDYTCRSEINACSCEGFIDCIDMILTDCAGEIVCGNNTCACTWKVRN